MFYIRKLLSESQLEEIKLLSERLEFEDGAVSFGGGKHIKDNMQAKMSPEHDTINDIIFKELDCDHTFLNFTSASSTGAPIYSRYVVGNYYKPHQDSPKNGHYSTTVFLNDPSTYEGGELCLLVNGEDKVIKPEAGWAVTYETGIVHSVNKITSGTRDALVFWTTSLIKKSEVRRIIFELNRAIALLDQYPEIICETNMDTNNSPQFILDKLRSDIVRDNT